MLKRIFSIICLSYSIGCSADMTILEMDDAVLNEIIANDHCCISNVTDDKVYINPDRIFPTQHGLFLNVDEDRIVAIPVLYSDSQGCYIQVAARVKVTKPCPYCGWERTSGAFKCRNKDCPSNQPKK